MSESPSTTPRTEPAEDYSTGAPVHPAPEPGLTLRSRLEALLFVSAGPSDAARLAAALGASSKDIDRALEELKQDLEARGLRLQHHRAGYQLTTAPQASE
ncbi:MAG: SMC-Scp complex subunit ScpB, partial [Chloroflexi bacterium]|nr:SMC-Scp complex subunit ScpB [Chloroflexota bacterium]